MLRCLLAGLFARDPASDPSDMAPPSITKDVQVPKNLHGKIIGKQAATLKDIESDYPGVKVTVPRRNDPSEFVRLAGPEDAVRRAERRVLDIAGVLSDEAAAERKKVDEAAAR